MAEHFGLPQAPQSPPPDAGIKPAVLACPECLKVVSVSPDQWGQTLACPHCGQDFALPAMAAPAGPVAVDLGDGFTVIDDEEPADSQRRRRDELDRMHMRHVAQLRRSAVRSRTYMLVLLIGCLAGIGQLIYLCYKFFQKHHNLDLQHWGYIGLALLLARLAVRFWRRAQYFETESHRTELAEPAAPPDFSTLSDGSQYWKNLDQLKK